MPYVAFGDVRLYYEERGPENASAARAPVVLLHGFTLDHRMWAEAVAYLSTERRVMAMDARGHGQSSAPPSGYSRADRVADLRAFVDRLELGRFHLVGLSMGGSTAIGYALGDQERLVSLTLVSTGAAGWDVGKKIGRIDQLVRERGLEAGRELWIDYSLRYYGAKQAGIRGRMERMMREHSGAVWMDERRGRYPSPGNDLERVHEIRVPTLVIAGSDDKIFVPLAKELGERIAGSRVVVYPGVGHMVNMEVPERFNTDLGAFLEAVESV